MKHIKKVLICLFLGAIILVIGYKGLFPIIAKMNPHKVDDLAGSILTERTYVEGTVNFASGEFLEVKHSINFIPTGYDHYFLVFSDDLSRCVAVRADTKWAEKFGEEGYLEEGLTIGGVVKDLGYEEQRELQDTMQMISQEGLPISAAGYYIDLLAYRYAIFMLIALVILVVLVIGGILLVKKGVRKSIWSTLYVILLIAECCFLLHIIAMIG